MDRLFRGFSFLGLTAVFIVGFSYLWHFRRALISQNPADWAAFGEYFGGTLGGIFGFLAFILVLITVYFQRRQLDQVRERAKSDDLKAESRFYLDEYRAGYDTAYSILSSAAAGDPQLRVKWIAAARVLESARLLAADRVTLPAHREVLKLDAPRQSVRFERFFDQPAWYFYGVEESELLQYEGDEFLKEAARASTTHTPDGASRLRWVPGKAVRTVKMAVAYPKDYEDVLGHEFDEGERLFLSKGLQEYLDHFDRWHSVLGHLIDRMP